MRGRGVTFIGGVSTPRAASCSAAHGEAALGVLPATWRSYPPRGLSAESSSIFVHVLFFDPISGAAVLGLLTGELWLPEVGVSELVFRIFPAKIPAKWGMPPANRELRLAAGLPTSVFNVLGTVGKLALPSSLKFWTCGKPSLGSRDMVPRTEATGVFLACRRAIFRLRFRLDRGKSCEMEKIFARAQHPPGGNYEIFSIVLFLPLVFAHMVDVAPDVGFWRSWCRRKAYITFFLKVLGSHRGELGFARCGPANRGRWNVSHAGGSSSDRDFGLTRGALDDPRVARCS
uniref:Uncharacterized protein n=1 Tax=Fagus sylvatica TaxID=28930 RepID=A0A2N9I763_FAGSY